jgi:hypothetical protein
MSEQTMAVSDDALKLLVAEHGVRGTARLLGMNESQTHAFRKRVTRAGWMQETAIAAIRAKSENVNLGRPAAPLVPALSPTAAIHAELAQLGSKTKLSIARGVAKASEHIEKMQGSDILEKSQDVKSVTQTAAIVHNWDRQAGAPKIRLELLANKGEVAAIEVESEVVSDDWADEY